MLKRIFFVRPLIVSAFFLLFVDVMAMKEGDATTEQKQAFLRENILAGGYNADEFLDFLDNNGGKKELKIENWTKDELEQLVKEFIAKKQEGKAPENLVEKDQIPANKEINENNNNNILQKNNEYNNEIKDGNNDLHNNFIGQNMALSVGNPNLLKQNNLFVQGLNNNISPTNLKSPFYDLSKNNIARRFFCFYRYGGKFLASLVWSVVNSYCGFEEIVMNDWYCYAMCSGYRLQPRFMRSRMWIDMNFNFLEGIAGFLIRFFLFYPSYDMYENIFDFFNVCIDIKVYNNLYFAVNIVGFVRSIVLLYILSDKLMSHFPEYE